MSGLVEFLRARLDEDEAAARNATEGPWFADHPEPKHWGDDPESALIVEGKVLCILDNQYNGPLNADHIVRHAPSRVLAEVEAKRRILDDVLPTMQSDEMRIAGEWGVGSEPVREASDDLLSLLALPYADHPDYREEWKP